MKYFRVLIFVAFLFIISIQELRALRGKKKETIVLPNYDDLFLNDGVYKILSSDNYVDDANLNKSLLRMIKITKNKFKKIKKSKGKLKDSCYKLGINLGLHILKHATVLTLRIMNRRIKKDIRLSIRRRNKKLLP
ncbi:Plasmodium exported protein, unknown function [Plasmodium ovale]|uniref:Fam-b protein n=2 Tax=Plasmodium ovale TaxID=36330 RepID=A0A1A8W898_PLAOA|nr:hypothetical protein POVCU2_0045240 [Plasmodium ovale curtisi]SBS97870.1 hypothetical protein POVCU1_041670 [Plasmodium ovale curtisi]SCQ16665.1 Plasmodium exported protein, unknown function [Plasmodium ovale]